MEYPYLETTPIKETIFSISYLEIVDTNCFEKFTNLEFIKERFKDIKPSIDQNFEIKHGTVALSTISNGFHLKNQNEIVQLRKGMFSFHFLNEYRSFNDLLSSFIDYWMAFDNITDDDLTVTDFSVRYINVIETDEHNQPTHLIQLYPKQSSDRIISNFQNSIEFRYREKPEYLVNAVSTNLNERGVLLDITIKGEVDETLSHTINLKKAFKPLQEIKNKAFFDSITARALLKYMEKIKKS